jgi:hypothetical protein
VATFINIYCRFSDGTYGLLVNSDVSGGATGEEIKTGGTGLAQVSGKSVGEAFVGKVMTHAVAQVSTQNAGTGALLWSALKSPNGNYIMPIQGGGQHFGDLPALKRPIQMAVGMQAWAAFKATADSATQPASFVGYCSDGYTDILTATGVDATKTELVNSNGATLGQSFAGRTLMCYYSTYPGNFGVNDNGGGVSPIYMESSDGQLKGLIPAVNTGGDTSESITPFVEIPIQINQNDGLFVMTDT